MGDVAAVGIGLERTCQVAVPTQHVAHIVETDGEIALGPRVAFVSGGELEADVAAVGIGLERAGQIALPTQHVANLVETDGEVALGLRVALIGGGELEADVAAVGIGFERARQITLPKQHVTDLLKAGGDVALGMCVAWVGGSELAVNFAAIRIGFERTWQIALLKQHVADSVETDGKVALCPFVIWVGGGQLEGDLAAVGKAVECACKITTLKQHVAKIVVTNHVAVIVCSEHQRGSCTRLGLQYVTGSSIQPAQKNPGPKISRIERCRKLIRFDGFGDVAIVRKGPGAPGAPCVLLGRARLIEPHGREQCVDRRIEVEGLQFLLGRLVLRLVARKDVCDGRLGGLRCGGIWRWRVGGTAALQCLKNAPLFLEFAL